MNNQFYEKVEKLCQKIDSYTEKDFSIKNEVKTKSYSEKIKELINMIEIAENNADVSIINTKQEIKEDKSNKNDEIIENKYDPYSRDFCYRDRLAQLNGDINKLIEELKAQDKKGYRNAYIIKEIEKYITPKANIKLRKRMSLWEKIKSFFV